MSCVKLICNVFYQLAGLGSQCLLVALRRPAFHDICASCTSFHHLGIT